VFSPAGSIKEPHMKGEKAFLAKALVAGIQIKPTRASAVETDGKVYHSGPAPGLFAVRKVSSGRFLITSVSLRVPHDIDFDDPEAFTKPLWWRALGADASLVERSSMRRP
jgi:hypothetical protein